MIVIAFTFENFEEFLLEFLSTLFLLRFRPQNVGGVDYKTIKEYALLLSFADYLLEAPVLFLFFLIEDAAALIPLVILRAANAQSLLDNTVKFLS